jgi:hypothetical protein
VNVVCIWAGEAIARFEVTNNGHDPEFINLRAGTIDTVIHSYKFSFVDLQPYPHTERPIQPGDYTARVIIRYN